MDIKKIRIDTIGLSARSLNALKRNGVKTIGDMIGYTEESLSCIRSMGQKSIDEVLEKIKEYQRYDAEPDLLENNVREKENLPVSPDSFDEWCITEEGKHYIMSWLEEQKIKTSSMALLSAKAYNLLLLNGYTEFYQIVFMAEEELMKIPHMDQVSAKEIYISSREYLKDLQKPLLEKMQSEFGWNSNRMEESVQDLLQNLEYRETLVSFVKANDSEVNRLGFSTRTQNALEKQGLFRISDFIFMPENEIRDIPQMGNKSVTEINSFIDTYLEKNENRIKALLQGDDGALLDDAEISKTILELYNDIGFGGLSFSEIRRSEKIPEELTDDKLKQLIGKLISEGQLEYVDFRCYRIYPQFEKYLQNCCLIKERNREFISRKLSGETLENIAKDYNMTRERVRQVISKEVPKVIHDYQASSGVKWFDEDYYRYFYETYDFEKRDAEEWLSVSKEIYNYLDMTGSKRGIKDLEEALDDYHNLDFGLRLKINNYLNRNKLYLDGKWIKKSRAELEEFIVRKYCRENVSYDEFVQLYNSLLEDEEITFDEDIYITEAVKQTRENKLSADRFLLWKQNKLIRYYDIDGQDYTELFDVLNLDAYENIEYSTQKFINDYPEIMQKYDIRDQYELHNLLRKIIPDGSYHDFHCKRMPVIEFGVFDRESAIFELLIDNAPISQTDFAEMVHQEYGHDPATVIGTYLQPLSVYYHQGMYTIDKKPMLPDNQKKLLSELKDDFYYIDEVRRIYLSIISNADPEEINSYNLKTMGFSVFKQSVLRNHDSLESYFKSILMKEDITDLVPLRKRFAYVQAFSSTFTLLKKNCEILEFEPNQVICFRKLAEAGITQEELKIFCDEVFAFVEEDTYFSIQSIKKEGFEAELFDLGFSDWFYANLAASDPRFTYSNMFSNIVLYKGSGCITIQTFEERLVKEHGSIDAYDLMTEMEDIYGCQIPDKAHMVYKLYGTNVHYDKYLDRLYANRGILDRELDAVEGGLL